GVLIGIGRLGWCLWPSGGSSEEPSSRPTTSGQPEYLKDQKDSTEFNPYKTEDQPLAMQKADTSWDIKSPEKLFGRDRAEKLKKQAKARGYQPQFEQNWRRKSRPIYRGDTQNGHQEETNQRQNQRRQTRQSAKESDLSVGDQANGPTTGPWPDREVSEDQRQSEVNEQINQQLQQTYEYSDSLIEQIPQTAYGSDLGIGMGGQAGLAGVMGAMRGAMGQNQKAERAGKDFEHAAGHQISSSSRKPKSPYTIQEGTPLPATLVSAVTSHLPGDIIALINRYIYDSIPQEYLPIPKGSKLDGTYDDKVVIDQRKLLMSWRRLIYPDGRSIDLGELNTYDLAAESGLSGKVNKHFWSMFGKSALLSLMGAGSAVATHPGRQSGSRFGRSRGFGQIAAQQIATNFNRVANQFLRQGMDRPPTIHIDQGTQFNVYLAGDISFPEPYSHHE